MKPRILEHGTKPFSPKDVCLSNFVDGVRCVERATDRWVSLPSIDTVGLIKKLICSIV